MFGSREHFHHFHHLYPLPWTFSLSCEYRVIYSQYHWMIKEQSEIWRNCVCLLPENQSINIFILLSLHYPYWIQIMLSFLLCLAFYRSSYTSWYMAQIFYVSMNSPLKTPHFCQIFNNKSYIYHKLHGTIRLKHIKHTFLNLFFFLFIVRSFKPTLEEKEKKIYTFSLQNFKARH